MPSQSYASRSFSYFLSHKPFFSATSNSKSCVGLADNIGVAKKNVPFWIWESLVLTLTRKWSSECSQLFLARVSKSSKCLGMTSCYAIYISNLLQMPQPRYAASKGQCISFLWTCARNAFRKFLPNQQQTQQIKVINLPPKQWSFSLSLFLSSAINEASPKSVLRSQVPSEHWSGDMRLVLEIQRCNYSQLNSQKNNSIPTWSSALKFSLVLQLPSLRTCLSKKGPFVGTVRNGR